jgi:hypothetical protein
MALFSWRRAGLMVTPIAKKLRLEFSVRPPTCQLMDDSGNYCLDVRPRAA